MGHLFIMLTAEQFAGVLIFFPIVWLFMRKRNGQKLIIGNLWLIGGFLATAIGVGAIRFLAIFIIDWNEAMNPGGKLGIFFFLVLPILTASITCSFLKTKANPIESKMDS